ncbi:MFS transporter [Marinagarivorans algicola]|uniref:MFS transporter n=1 Tax=Marinagarivorans algicola TaxID=1513270 RepID=UPI0006B4E6B3|nr:MFS transporter [Marinagarivorans algicola]
MLKSTLYPAIGLTYISHGAQWVVITWLAIDILSLSPIAVGSLVAAMLLVQVALLPIAGRMADTIRPTLLAQWTATGLCVSHLLLVGVVLAWWFNIVIFVLYALFTSAITAFFLPAKDKACVELLPNRLQKALALGSAFQFLGVAIGAMIAGFIDDVGLTGILILQSFLMALAAVYWGFIEPSSAVRIRDTLPDSATCDTLVSDQSVKNSTSHLMMLFKANGVLRHLLALCAFNGFMHMGFAVALFPVLGIQHWGFDNLHYAIMQGVFSLGAVVVYVSNAYRKPQQYPGQGMLFCLLYTAAIAYAITREPTFWGSYGLIFLWGVTAGYSASMSRIVLHSIVREHERGRTVALYQMVLLSAAPLGCLACGLILHFMNMTQTLYVLSSASVIVFIIFLFSRRLWAVEQACASER